MKKIDVQDVLDSKQAKLEFLGFCISRFTRVSPL